MRLCVAISKARYNFVKLIFDFGQYIPQWTVDPIKYMYRTEFCRL